MNPFVVGELKTKREVEVFGRVAKAQLFRPESQEWLLPRINPSCENCNNNDYYR